MPEVIGRFDPSVELVLMSENMLKRLDFGNDRSMSSIATYVGIALERSFSLCPCELLSLSIEESDT